MGSSCTIRFALDDNRMLYDKFSNFFSNKESVWLTLHSITLYKTEILLIAESK